MATHIGIQAGDQYRKSRYDRYACIRSKRRFGACTTSGMAYKLNGRVGDSPIIGAGLFVDNEIGGATATGVGEEVIRVCGSHLVVELMRQNYSPQEACEAAVNRIIKARKRSAKRFSNRIYCFG